MIYKTFESFVKENVDYYDHRDRVVMYVADKYFHIDPKKLKRIDKGTEGIIYSDDTDKIIKITQSRKEGERVERLKGKHTRNLMPYYDVKQIDYYHNTYWVILMDKLPKILNKDKLRSSIFNILRRKFGEFDGSHDQGKINNNQNIIINTRSRDRMKIIKKLVNDYCSNDLKNLDNNSKEDVFEIAYDMLFDLINIRMEMKKYGIELDDMWAANLGFTDYDRLIYFDFGYHGTGSKKLKDTSIHNIGDKDTEHLKDFNK